MADPIPVISRAEFEKMGGSMSDSPADHPGQAFVEGGLDASTVGLAGDSFLGGFYHGRGTAKSAQEGMQQVKARAEANPGWHAAGEVTGTAASMLLPGGGAVGALSKGARGAAEALNVGKTATRAVAGGIEGGVYGLSNAMNEDYMGDPKLNAEHVAAGIFGGGLAGAGINTAFGKMGDLGKSALIKAFGGDAVKGKLSDLAESALMKSIAGEKDLAKRSLEARSEGIAQFALDEGFAKAGVKGGYKGAAEAADTRAKQAYNDIQSLLAEADAKVKAGPTTAPAAKKGSFVPPDPFGQNAGLSPAVQKGSFIPPDPFGQRAGIPPAAPAAPAVISTKGAFDPLAAAARLQAKIDSLQGSELASTRAKLQNFVDKNLSDIGTPGVPETPPGHKYWDLVNEKWVTPPAGEPVPRHFVGKEAVPGAPAVPAVAGEAPTSFKQAWAKVSSIDSKGEPEIYNILRADLKDEIFKQATAVDQGLGNRLDQAAREQAQALEFRTLASNKATASKGYSPGDYAAAAFGFHAGGIPGLLAAPIKRGIRERAGFAAASALDALSENGTLPKIADGFRLFMKSRLTDPGFGGVFRQTLEAAAAKGSMDLLNTHVSLAKDPQYMQSVGMEHEDPSTVASHIDRAHGLAKMANAIDATGDAMDKAIDRGLTPGTAKKYSEPRAHSREEYEALKTKLQALVSSTDSINKNLSNLAPQTASLAAMNVVGGAKYLLDKAPKNPTEGLPPALQRPWAPAPGDIRSWYRRVDAVANPMSVLEQMNGGIVTKEMMESLATVYPALASNIQHRMMDRLSAWKAPLDRARRGHVSQIIGDISDPGVTQTIQAAHMKATPPPSAGQKPDGRETIDAAKNEQTQAQRLEGK